MGGGCIPVIVSLTRLSMFKTQREQDGWWVYPCDCEFAFKQKMDGVNGACVLRVLVVVSPLT
jgi:hypothetical protein